MRDRSIVFDIDGVVADFEGAFCKQFGSNKRDRVSLEQRYPLRAKEIREFSKSPSVYDNLEVLPLGKHINSYLHKHGFIIDIVSSRPETLSAITQRWLQRNGIYFDSLWIGNSVPKAEHIRGIKAICAIDDLGQVLDSVAPYRIPGILISSKWNYEFRKKYPRIDNFGKFLYHFRKILGAQNASQKSSSSGRSLQQCGNQLESI